MSQVGWGQINTAYIERLNATFRTRMPDWFAALAAAALAAWLARPRAPGDRPVLDWFGLQFLYHPYQFGRHPGYGRRFD
jgi:hypothetical protein